MNVPALKLQSGENKKADCWRLRTILLLEVDELDLKEEDG